MQRPPLSLIIRPVRFAQDPWIAFPAAGEAVLTAYAKRRNSVTEALRRMLLGCFRRRWVGAGRAKPNASLQQCECPFTSQIGSAHGVGPFDHAGCKGSARPHNREWGRNRCKIRLDCGPLLQKSLTIWQRAQTEQGSDEVRSGSRSMVQNRPTTTISCKFRGFPSLEHSPTRDKSERGVSV